MIKTESFYHVAVGEIVDPPENVYQGDKRVTYSPFPRPTRIGNTFIGENSSDESLVALGLYRLWTDAPPNPGSGYALSYGTPEVTGDIVLRTDSWEEIPAAEVRASLQSEILAQSASYTQTEMAEDSVLRWNLDINVRQINQALSDLANAEDEQLQAFDSLLSAHPLSVASYGASLAAQEIETLLRDSQLKETGDEGILTATQRSDMLTRVAQNAIAARGLSGSVTAPTSGNPRALASLEGEEVSVAGFEEVSFDWAGTDYFIPKVKMPPLPEWVNSAQVFAMVYDQGNVYRSWMPFIEQPDGSWLTPSDVSYISIAKLASSVWRVAVAYLGTSADYEITDRVVLAPPDISTSSVRWGGTA